MLPYGDFYRLVWWPELPKCLSENLANNRKGSAS